MEINVNGANQVYYDLASKYFPIRLSTTIFDGIGECLCLVANRADEMFHEIAENEDSEVFIMLKQIPLYEDMKNRVEHMDYWEPDRMFHTVIGDADGLQRIIHFDGSAF